MGRGPVELHADPVLLVEVIEVPVACPLPNPGLPAGGREPVRDFYAADVAIFKKRQGAIIGITECGHEFAAPAHLLARVHRVAYPGRGGTPAPDGPADPRVGVVEGPRMRSSTVSSTRVHGGNMVGCLVRRIVFDRCTTTPGIFCCAGCRRAGTVIVMTSLGSSIRPCRSAAVWWLRVASGPARSRAAHSVVSRAGCPENDAYTPVEGAAICRCGACCAWCPGRFRNPCPGGGLWRRPGP
jgi:hypothetical protein